MSLKNNETPLLHRFWQKTGGTLVEEFYAVQRGKHHSERRIDGIIIKDEDFAIRVQNKVVIEGKNIIVVQVKTGRLGMNLMGQTVFSCKLMERFNPRSIEAVALCQRNDDVLAQLLVEFPNIKVVIDEE